MDMFIYVLVQSGQKHFYGKQVKIKVYKLETMFMLSVLCFSNYLQHNINVITCTL